MINGNLYDDIPAELPDELVQSLLEHDGVRIERIVSKGHASPEGFWYDQPEHEWVVLLKGSAMLQFDDEATVHKLEPGDYLFIAAHRRHRVMQTAAGSETVWLALFFR